MKGEASFSFVDPVQPAQPAAGHWKPTNGSATREYALPPEPILPLATPIYPKSALASSRGSVTVGVRVNIDRNGLVTGTEPSLAVFSTPNSHDSGFREAVEKAVMQWHFLPARLQRPSTLKATDGKAAPMEDSETIEWSVDVAFTFTASGDVLPSGSGKAGDSK